MQASRYCTIRLLFSYKFFKIYKFWFHFF